MNMATAHPAEKGAQTTPQRKKKKRRKYGRQQ
jgi:hypothetical protein